MKLDNGVYNKSIKKKYPSFIFKVIFAIPYLALRCRVRLVICIVIQRLRSALAIQIAFLPFSKSEVFLKHSEGYVDVLIREIVYLELHRAILSREFQVCHSDTLGFLTMFSKFC